MRKIIYICFLLIPLITSALRGIDVSYHDGEIDFAKVKPQVDFVIMRAGYGIKDEDSKEVKFNTYYEDAKKNNIPVGTYWYCYALTPESALQEAKVFLKKVKGKKFEFPVYYDVEEPSVLETGSENLKNIINTFCGELEKNNYYCGVYASLNVFLNKFPAEIYQKYAVWVAYWSQNRPQINGTSWGIWQYTSDGSMDGVQSERVDFDTAEINYEPIIKFLGKNGYDKYSK
jgi:GH25 family lysozyme M1 (1,4-beta-N-acetylmuramidase)